MTSLNENGHPSLLVNVMSKGHLHRYKLLVFYGTTVQDRHQITQNVLGEHKVITTEQQFLGVILSFFYAFKMAVAITSLRGFAVEAV